VTAASITSARTENVQIKTYTNASSMSINSAISVKGT